MITHKPKLISKNEGSPCHNCLIGMTCTKSFILRTACEDYRDFISKLIEPFLSARKDVKKEKNET